MVVHLQCGSLSKMFLLFKSGITRMSTRFISDLFNVCTIIDLFNVSTVGTSNESSPRTNHGLNGSHGWFLWKPNLDFMLLNRANPYSISHGMIFWVSLAVYWIHRRLVIISSVQSSYEGKIRYVLHPTQQIRWCLRSKIKTIDKNVKLKGNDLQMYNGLTCHWSVRKLIRK